MCQGRLFPRRLSKKDQLRGQLDRAGKANWSEVGGSNLEQQHHRFE
jgi:hypothetical protein